MNTRQLVHRHPLGVFLVWFFTVGQAIVFVPVVTDLPTEPFIITSTFVGLLLPAAVITRIVDGPDGFRALRRLTFRADLPVRWYALALIGVPTAIVTVAVATAGVPPTSPGLVSTVGVGFLVQLSVVLVTVNWWEEVAWMGFVQARLQTRHGAMHAAALTGAAFAAGHISLVLGGGLSATMTLAALLLAVSIPLRALAAWSYNHTGSLLLVGMIHAAANAVAVGSILGAGLLPRLYGDDRSSGLAFPVLAVIGLAVIVVTRARLGHQPPRQLHPPHSQLPRRHTNQRHTTPSQADPWADRPAEPQRTHTKRQKKPSTSISPEH